ncbi:unnamed protein product [Symbiodinium sp. CCMP2592]|nr:unnamed protein product [Symbiodinium sp. CCMP2592]
MASEPASSSSGQRQRRPQAWLVWCFEHCRKVENQNMHGELGQIASQCGMQLVLHKKFSGFLEWFRDVSSEDTVLLLTDWREVKPIVQGLGGQGQGCPHLRLCILAQSFTAYRSAVKWVNSQTGREMPVFHGFTYESVLQVTLDHMAEAAATIGYSHQAQEAEEPPSQLEGYIPLRSSSSYRDLTAAQHPQPAPRSRTVGFVPLPESLADPDVRAALAARLDEVMQQSQWVVYED